MVAQVEAGWGEEDTTTKVIELTKGYVTLVDAKNYDWLSAYSWCADVRPHTVYVVRSGSILMHRMIMGFPRGVTIDHIDRNGLNNLESNLRVATALQQQGNKVGHGASGVKGVSQRSNGRWRAYIGNSRRHIHLGYFDTMEEAEAAYAKAATEYFGEFTLEGGAKKMAL